MKASRLGHGSPTGALPFSRSSSQARARSCWASELVVA